MLKLEPIEGLRRKAWILRDEYRQIAKTGEYAQYEASQPPDPATALEADLRTDLVKIQEELNWAYTVLWVQEEFRNKLTKRIVGITLVVIAVFVGLAITTSGMPWIGFLSQYRAWLPIAAVSFVGILGGFISTLRRIQLARLDGNSDLNLIELERGHGSIYISPFLGGVFANLLFLLFASGLLTGPLFPTIAPGERFFGIAGPVSGAELAKLLIWCFIAGFAEKFVPDRLEQLAQKGTEAQSNPKPRPEPSNPQPKKNT